MRRRSERKKSVDPSPVTSSRRSSRRTSRRTPDVEKSEDAEQRQNETPTKSESSPNRASSEERMESNKRGRNTRSARTPAKRQLRNISGADNKIDAITEEENGLITSVASKEENLDNDISSKANVQVENEERNEAETVTNVVNEESKAINENAHAAKNEEEEQQQRTVNVTELYMAKEDVEMQDANVSEKKSNYNEEQKITEVLIIGNAGVETQQVQEETPFIPKATTPKQDQVEKQEQDATTIVEKTPNGKHVHAETEEALGVKVDATKKIRTLSNHNAVSNEPNRARKRKWLSKKTTENKETMLAISTDSLKNLIADVQPVPLSDVKLESSSEVEEVPSEHKAREISSSPSDHERRRNSIDKVIPDKIKPATEAATTTAVNVPRTGLPLQSSPSPPRNQTSNVLYITNLVRPFTVMQLKGLLARTGKIVENGFWIDRIKSKCYVQYETEDEAIETRHALHGVRWPVSNPKCLNVDFGKLADMERAIQLSNDDAPKYEKETKENYISSGNTWTREQLNDDERKDTKPIREWDLGKREAEKQRSTKENAGKEDKFKKGRRERESRKSRSESPVRKVKKEEPPLRLLDDLFRKTKATPCIYWLPLTPEQIAEKEAYRQKRIEERKERIKQRELDREKEQELERERERNRSRERDRSRDRSHDRSRERRRNRSSDRRRSRSRDRRRY